MKTLSLRDAAFALDGSASTSSFTWTVRESIEARVFPEFTSEPWSIREITARYSSSGAALRSLAQGVDNAWALIDRQKVVDEIAARLRDPLIIHQLDTGFCGPFSILVEWIRRKPVHFINCAKELLETGKFTCETGRVIEAEDDLRKRPAAAKIAQVEWLMAATMRDEENIIEDVDDGKGIEVITMMGAMSGWTQDILNLKATEVGGVHSSTGEEGMMYLAEATVKAGGVAFLFIDANMIKNGGDDDEEEMYFQKFLHRPQLPIVVFTRVHSEDDNWPPDHWVIYFDGLNFGRPPDSNDAVSIRLWSWGSEYVVTGTAEAFGEYLYGVVAGN
jgi:hypothetical protein